MMKMSFGWSARSCLWWHLSKCVARLHFSNSLLDFSDLFCSLESSRLRNHWSILIPQHQIADGLAGSCGGVLRGQGKELSMHRLLFVLSSANFQLKAASTSALSSTSLRTMSSRFPWVSPLPSITSSAFRAFGSVRLDFLSPAPIRFLAHYVAPYSFASNSLLFLSTMPRIGQVVALFLVGLGEYGVVWFGTNWEKEVKKGIERNNAEDAVTG